MFKQTFEDLLKKFIYFALYSFRYSTNQNQIWPTDNIQLLAKNYYWSVAGFKESLAGRNEQIII